VVRSLKPLPDPAVFARNGSEPSLSVPGCKLEP
ncbi:MAG: hypothetical protein JWR45_2262, partial [Blastococcus sp.]|nr:hypothetical protein [Blastococcus sp.]